MAENKKLALLRIYQLLQQRTDAYSPMTQADMIAALRREYGIEIDRRTVSRNLSLLKEAGVEIASDRGGSWLADEARPFTEGELQLLIDSVLSSYFIPRGQTEDLVEKLSALSSDTFRSRVKRRASAAVWEKTESQTLFLNVETITDAIGQERQIRFTWMQRGVDLKQHPLQQETVTPLQLLQRNDRYFLFALVEDTNEKTKELFKTPVWVMTYDLDEIRDVEILCEKAVDPRQSPLFPHGFSIERLRSISPELTPVPFEKPKPVRATLACTEDAIGTLVAWFGKNIRIEPLPPLCEDGIDNIVWETLDPAAKYVKATVQTTESAVFGYLMRYGGLSTLLAPKPLFEKWLSATRDTLTLMEQIAHAAECAENGT